MCNGGPRSERLLASITADTAGAAARRPGCVILMSENGEPSHRETRIIAPVPLPHDTA